MKNVLSNKGRPNVDICFAEEHFEEEQFEHFEEEQCSIIISIQISTLKGLFETQAFRVFIARMRFFWCDIWVYLKSEWEPCM